MRKRFFLLMVLLSCAFLSAYGENADLLCIRLFSDGIYRNRVIAPARIMLEEVRRWGVRTDLEISPEKLQTEKASSLCSSVILPFVLEQENETYSCSFLKLNLFSAEFPGLRFYGLASGLFSDDELFLAGIQSTLFAYAREMNGVQLALLYGIAEKMNGIQTSFQAFANSACGVQLSASGNFAENVSGLQIAGSGNISSKTVNGLQIAGLVNSAEKICGIQAALFGNIAREDFTGLQIGLFNFAAKKTHGIQIGLLNRIDGAWIRYFPLIHFSFHSEKK